MLHLLKRVMRSRRFSSSAIRRIMVSLPILFRPKHICQMVPPTSTHRCDPGRHRQRRTHYQAVHAISRCHDDGMDHSARGDSATGIRDNGCTVDAGWDFDRELVSNHGPYQVAGNPKDPRPPCKFHNYWTIVTPPGWSCLFIPPVNRPHPVFEVSAVSSIAIHTDHKSISRSSPTRPTANTRSSAGHHWCRSSRSSARPH